MKSNDQLLNKKKQAQKKIKVENTKANFRQLRIIIIVVLLIIGFLVFREMRKPPSIDEIDKVSVGDTVTFGDNNCEAWGWLWSYRKPVEWIVIDKDDEKAVLMTKYAFKYFGDYEEVMGTLNNTEVVYLGEKRPAISFYTYVLHSDSRILMNGDYHVTMLTREQADSKIDTIPQIKDCKSFSSYYEHLIFKWKDVSYRLYDDDGYITRDGNIVDELDSKEKAYCRPVIWVKLSK